MQTVLDGVTILLKTPVHSLDDPDSSLSLDAQISVVARSAFAQLKVLSQLHQFLKMSDLSAVTNALLTFILDYCIMVYVRLPLKMVQKLPLVQNAAPRLLTALATTLLLGPIQSCSYYL